MLNGVLLGRERMGEQNMKLFTRLEDSHSNGIEQY